MAYGNPVVLTATPNRYTGVITILGAPSGNTTENAVEITIRRTDGGGNQVDIKTMSVSSVADLTFTIDDYSCVPGREYTYSCAVVYDNSGRLAWDGPTLSCRLDGLFIGNDDKQYVAQANFEVEHERNTMVEYVTTLASKYPYRVSNSAANYSSGTARGLFMRYNPNNNTLTPDYDHTLATEIIDFLTDGTDKILKTHDGLAFCVGINSNPKEEYSEFMGAHLVSFDWTEIGSIESYLESSGS